MIYGETPEGLCEPIIYGGYGVGNAEQKLYEKPENLTDSIELVSDRQVKRGSKMCYVPELGKIFASINALSREIGIDSSAISRALRFGHGKARIGKYEIIEVVE